MSDPAPLDGVYGIRPLQKLLLRGLILEGPRGADSRRRWLEEADLTALDNPSVRLLPALFRLSGNENAASEKSQQLKGVYRFFHFRTSTVLATARQTLERFRDARIDVLAFKGLALALKYHESPMLRPMGDIDVLVRPDDVQRAETLLFGLGWKYLSVYDPAVAPGPHAHSYINSVRVGFDLHWFSLLESLRPGIDDATWQRAQFFDWEGLVIKAMSPEDLLITGIVNGVRGRDAMDLHWILDVARILAKEPAIQWPVFWEEAGRRGLQDKIFDALHLVNIVADEVVPKSLLDSLLRLDPQFERRYLDSAVAEGRRPGLAGDAPGAAATPAQYVRYVVDADQAVIGLSMPRRLLPCIEKVFEVRNAAQLDALIAGLPATEEVELRIPPGLLTFTPYGALPSYAAEVVISGASSISCDPGAVLQIGLEVSNTSPHFWTVRTDRDESFGVSCHLQSEDGTLLAWDMPRAFLNKEWNGYVAFVQPSQKVACTLEITAPNRPGRYALQVDMVQEHVAWFSSKGTQFPRIELEVRGEVPAAPRLALFPGIAHETVGSEAMIVNTHDGAYYTASGYAAQIWKAIADGHHPEAIGAAFAALNSLSVPSSEDIARFVAELTAEHLVRMAEASRAAPSRAPCVETLPDGGAPALVRHAALPALLAMHPVRDVDRRLGWPYPAPGSN